MRFIYLIFGIVLCVLLTGFVVKNIEPVELHYYLGLSWRASLAIMLLITFLIGMAVGMAMTVSTLIKQRRRLLALERELKALNPAINK